LLPEGQDWNKTNYPIIVTTIDDTYEDQSKYRVKLRFNQAMEHELWNRGFLLEVLYLGFLILSFEVISYIVNGNSLVDFFISDYS